MAVRAFVEIHTQARFCPSSFWDPVRIVHVSALVWQLRPLSVSTEPVNNSACTVVLPLNGDPNWSYTTLRRLNRLAPETVMFSGCTSSPSARGTPVSRYT